MQLLKAISKIKKQPFQTHRLVTLPSKKETTIQQDPLLITVPDPTSRHYGWLTTVKWQLQEAKVQTSNIQQYVDVYRKYGHLYAKIDPLQKIKRLQDFASPLDFDLTYQEEIQQQLDSKDSHIASYVSNMEQLEKELQEIYTSSVGVEFDHVASSEQRNWLYKNFEKYMKSQISDVEKRNIHSLLVQTEAFDHYLHKKYNTFKRYSGEGVETSISALKALCAKASELGVKECVLGMPHRGRLNILCNVLDYPAEHLMRKIKGLSDMPNEFYTGIDDVISHIAISKTKRFVGQGCNEQPITVSLMHNPSHLELINPASQGKTRAKQDEYRDKSQVLNVQFHGDAAFAAQGVVYESFAIAGVSKYSVGGTIHIIVNNQIGYTTSVKDSRGHFYCSDIGKMYSTPILHVNSDDPEAIHRIVKFAAEYRQTFQKDIIIDLIGYRKYGHNELDEPMFTQPLYYKQIKDQQLSSPQIYHQKLVKEGVVKEQQFQNLREKTFKYLDQVYDNQSKNSGRPLQEYTNEDSKGQCAFTKKWKSMNFSVFGLPDAEIKTGLKAQYLKNICKQSVVIPPDFKVHPRLQKYFIEERINMIEKNSIDWATAEAGAIGSLLEQSYNVRLSGEDVERGTFSQRHWVLVDQHSEKEWIPLKELSEARNKGNLYVCNSPLSESAVLSYEYGYSLENPHNLAIWEAQFGDFFNCAQTTFDTLVLASEEKWARQSGLVTILPHGFDGAGPEHSSCKIERFLQQGSSDGIISHYKYKEHDVNRGPLQIEDQHFYANHQDTNFSFVQPTTPANYFHVLRRQMLRNYRKPLIVAGPKTLLRHPQCKSSFEEMDEGTQFLPVLKRFGVTEKTKVVILCSGKVSYIIQKFIEEKKQSENVALLVIEELLPFPEQIIQSELKNASGNETQFIWVQEEPSNSGPYTYVTPHITRILNNLNFENKTLEYIGRKSVAGPAHGSHALHRQEDQQIIKQIEKYFM